MAQGFARNNKNTIRYENKNYLYCFNVVIRKKLILKIIYLSIYFLTFMAEDYYQVKKINCCSSQQKRSVPIKVRKESLNHFPGNTVLIFLEMLFSFKKNVSSLNLH